MLDIELIPQVIGSKPCLRKKWVPSYRKTNDDTATSQGFIKMYWTSAVIIKTLSILVIILSFLSSLVRDTRDLKLQDA